MTGYYLMARGWLDHPALDGGREPYCRRAAWAWLIEAARYQDGSVNIAGKTVALKRGQLTHSTRFLASVWGWSEAGVRRFLDRLKTDALIDASTDAGQTVITVCNYEKYQARSDDGDAAIDAPTDAAATRDRRSSDANKKQGNKGNEGKEIEADASIGDREQPKAPRGKSGQLESEFASFWAVYPLKAAKDAARKAFGQAVQRGASVGDLVLGARRYADQERAKGTLPKYIKHPSTWLNGGCWQDEPEPAPDLFPAAAPPQAPARGRPGKVNFLDIARGLMGEQDHQYAEDAPFLENVP